MDKPERILWSEASKLKFLNYVDRLEAYIEFLEKKSKK